MHTQGTDFSMATIGRSLGAPIRDRERVEMTYPEVFYKQRLLGLSVWFALFLYTFHLFLKIPRQTKQFGLPFFRASLFVFIATASNTFLTGSIGMAVVLISTACLLVCDASDGEPISDGARRLVRPTVCALPAGLIRACKHATMRAQSMNTTVLRPLRSTRSSR